MKTELIEVKSLFWIVPIAIGLGTIMIIALYFMGELPFLPLELFILFNVFELVSAVVFLRAVIRKSGSVFLTNTGIKSIHLILDRFYDWKNIETFVYKEQENRNGLSKVLHAKLKDTNKEVPLLVYSLNGSPLLDKYTEDGLIKHLEQWQKQFT